jgi:hypothetical protein
MIEFKNMARLQYLESLRADAAKISDKSLIPYGKKIYSQNDEDGIIAEIFNRIGTTNKIFVEFGVENGLECNTLALLFQGWKGLWIEGSEAHVNKIKNGLRKTIAKGNLSIAHSFITRENIDSTISSVIHESEIDLLSVDIDGNDYHVFSAITCVRPRVVVIEYNAKFPPSIKYCQEYNENHRWDGSDNFGISLSALTDGLRDKGYCLVGCNLTGANAFFVRQDVLESWRTVIGGTIKLKRIFHAPFAAENHYQPARYSLCGFTSGHPASYATLENMIQN